MAGRRSSAPFTQMAAIGQSSSVVQAITTNAELLDVVAKVFVDVAVDVEGALAAPLGTLVDAAVDVKIAPAPHNKGTPGLAKV